MRMTTRNPGVPEIMIDYNAPEDGLSSTPEKKCPKALLPFFADKKPITKEIGEKLKAWAAGGVGRTLLVTASIATRRLPPPILSRGLRGRIRGHGPLRSPQGGRRLTARPSYQVAQSLTPGQRPKLAL